MFLRNCNAELFGNNILNEKYVYISSQNVSQKFSITRNIQPEDTTNVKWFGVTH